MEEELDLQQYWQMLKKHWRMIIAIPLIATLMSGLVSFFVIKPVYQASTTLIVGKKTSDLPVQQAGQILDYDVLMANQQLVKTYSAIAKSRTVEDDVIKELNLPFAIETLDRKISVVPVKDTEILAITVEDINPEQAAQIANEMANQFSQAVMDIKKVDSISIVDKAIAPLKPVKPNKILNVFIAFVIGLMVSIGLAFLREYLDNTIKTTHDAENLLGLPVLGMIPHYETDDL
ncbi:YveK family protein [Desulfitobacterium metallireducens]|uniref:Lipopolysaccharide biosynthesis protein n=1 Tax=Desulfitobacterium metallireducens DSM 15288 TaxID=871968 RepID=W0EA08_9FIRM|nr:Wzz/FepE/Etk N-terminal domain-containing protein [Desulfitobacterium metallireducens]AHF07670.1 lipopolysaccharide biosynthesis protein [Desulfitobacterium metallireducens DSM 15288]